MTLLKITEIKKHELLTSDQTVMCRAMRDESRRTGEDFTMHDFAKIALRACARNYADGVGAPIIADAELRRAAILYVYEALKACDIAIIKQWPEFDEMLRSLTYLSGDMP